MWNFALNRFLWKSYPRLCNHFSVDCRGVTVMPLTPLTPLLVRPCPCSLLSPTDLTLDFTYLQSFCPITPILHSFLHPTIPLLSFLLPSPLPLHLFFSFLHIEETERQGERLVDAPYSFRHHRRQKKKGERGGGVRRWSGWRGPPACKKFSQKEQSFMAQNMQVVCICHEMKDQRPKVLLFWVKVHLQRFMIIESTTPVLRGK